MKIYPPGAVPKIRVEDAREGDPGRYTPEYSMVERTSRSVDFTKASTRPIEAIRDPNGDVLILDPKDDLLRKSAPAVDLMHQRGRDDSTRDVPDDTRDYDGADALDTLQTHLPAVRLDANGRTEPKKPDGADVMYDPEDAITRPSAPAAVFGPMTGRDIPRKGDGSLQDGDVLDQGVVQGSFLGAQLVFDINVTGAVKNEWHVRLMEENENPSQPNVAIEPIKDAAGNALEFGTISSGTYSVHKIDEYYYGTSTSNGASTDYLDIAGGNTVNFTPTSTNDKVHFNHWSSVNFSDGNGCDVYLNMTIIYFLK